VKRLVSTLSMVVVLAGLGAYIYFVDSKKPADGGEVKEKAFGELSADDIEELQVGLPDGKPAKLVKTTGTWRLVEPSAADADANEVQSVLTSLSTLDIQRVVDEKGGDLSQYGLAPAQIDLSFKVKGQTAPKHILLGNKTSTGGDIYAKMADAPRVFLVAAFNESTFRKDPFSLRDKAVLKVDRTKVDGFTVTTGKGTLEFAKKDASWTIVKPLAARADFGAVEGAIERLVSTNMQALTAETAGDLKAYGLDKPTATMVVKTGDSAATLILGKTENSVVYAKDVSRPMVFTVAPILVTDVAKDLADFRRKDVFDVRSFNADRVEFTRGTTTQVFEKKKEKDKDVWKNSSGADVDTAKIEDLLTKVSGLRASSFETAAPSALKTPALTVKTDFGGQSETVTIAKAGSDAFAARADEPGAAKLDATALDEVLKALDALK
jgi:hypothetical protein